MLGQERVVRSMSISAIAEDFYNQFKWQAESAAKLSACHGVAERLGLLKDGNDCEGLQYCSISIYPEAELTLIFYGTDHTLDVETERYKIVDVSSRLMGDFAKSHLALFDGGKLDKNFDGSNNYMELSGKVSGVRVRMRASPSPTCKIERVEEEVAVEEKVVPAHTEKRVRYVLSGDCEPLLAAPTEQVPVLVAVAVAEDDIPF